MSNKSEPTLFPPFVETVYMASSSVGFCMVGLNKHGDICWATVIKIVTDDDD